MCTKYVQNVCKIRAKFIYFIFIFFLHGERIVEKIMKESAIIIRNVPASVRRELKSKSALEGKSMQGIILELIKEYISK